MIDEDSKLAPLRPLAWVLLAGAAVRLALLLWFHGEPLYVEDEQHYFAIARNLVARGEFAITAGDLTSIRPPLYPALLSAVLRFAGVDNFTAARSVQCLVGLLTTVVVYQLAASMYGRRTALLAAGLACFYPSLLFMEQLLLTETLFTFLLCLSCLILQRFLACGSATWLFAFGITWGLAALTRSVLWLLPPFIVVFVFVASRYAIADGRLERDPRNGWLRGILLAQVPVIAFCVTIAPWTVRNTLLQQTFTTIDDMGGRNFMMGNYEHTPLLRAWDAIGVRGERAWDQVLAREHPGFFQLTQGQKDKLAMKRGIRFALQNPLLTAERCAVKFLNFWQLERTVAAGLARGFWGHLPRPAVLGIAALIAGVYAMVLLAGVVGFVMTRPADVRMHWYLLMLIGFVCAVHTAVFGHARYHLPLMPLVAIYAAAAVVHRRRIWDRRRSWAAGIAAVICLLTAASWVWEVVLVELPRLRQALGAE